MSIIICGIPVNEEGLYYCPICGFTSDDLENFATTSCWDCVYIDMYADYEEYGKDIAD